MGKRWSGQALVGASGERDGEARMIVDDAQRMAQAAASELRAAFEIHLPQIVGLRALETTPGLRASRLGPDQAMAVGRGMDGRDRRRRQPARGQDGGDLARPPRRMLPPHRADRGFERVADPARTGVGTARAVGEILLAGGAPTQPQMPRLAADPEAQAQLRDVGSLKRRQLAKRPPLLRHRRLPPRHRRPPVKQVRLSGISPNKCQVCPQNEQQGRP